MHQPQPLKQPKSAYQYTDHTDDKGDLLHGARLAVKLRGRTTTSGKSRGPALSPGPRCAEQITHHGPSNDC